MEGNKAAPHRRSDNLIDNPSSRIVDEIAIDNPVI